MLNKTSYSIIIPIIFSLVVNTFAANIWWAGGDPAKGGADNLWSNAQNWDPDGVPGVSDSIWIEGYNSSVIPCVLDYPADDIHWLWIQNYGNSVDAELRVESGGSLAVRGPWYMANQTAKKAVLTVNGGSLTVDDNMLIGYQNGTAELHLNSGRIDVEGILYIAFGTWSAAETTIGRLYLNGGEIHVRYHVLLESHDGGGTLEGKIFINDNGTLYIGGNYAGYVQNWINEGKLVYSGSTPGAEIVIDYPVGAETRVSVWTPPVTAYNPFPADGFAYAATAGTLLWTPGEGINSHNVYFGTDYHGVDTANTSSPEFQGSYPVDVSQFQSGTLVEETTYYWRIDGISNGNTYKGDVWSFTTGKLETWLTFDEGAGDTAYDSSGNDRDCSLKIGEAWTSGQPDGALDLTGTGDYAIINNTNLLMPNAITVAVWLKFNSTSPQFVMYKGGGAWGLQKWPGRCMQFYCVGLSPNNQVNGTIPVDDGQWHHVAAVYDGLSFHLYVDGVLDTSAEATGRPDQYTSHTYNFWLGDGPDSTGYEFDGFVGEVRIYSYALSAAQISEVYENSLDSNLAWNPGPHHNAQDIAVDADLSWSPGEDAVTHEVYFGTDYDLVNGSGPVLLEGDIDGNGVLDVTDLTTLAQEWLGGTGLSDLDDSGEVDLLDYALVVHDWGQYSAFRGSTDATSFDPGPLDGGRTYYWRIDEVGDSGTRKGKVWQFTATPLTAWNPSPGNDAIVLDLDTNLAWSVGLGAVSHNVYFGTDYDAVSSATVFSPECKGNHSASNFEPGLLALDTPYYWRIDERDGDTVHKGQIWSFEVSDEWLFNFHGRLEWTEMVTAYTVQGLMNRNGAKLFIDTTGGGAHDLTIDAFWRDYLENEKGYRFAEIDNLRDLIQLARNKGYINGLVLYEPANISNGEIAIAVNMSAQNGLLPVTSDMLTYSSDGLYDYGATPCFSGLGVDDIRGTWSTLAAAQQYNVDHFLAGSTTSGAFWNNRLARVSTNYDWAVMQKCFVMDLDPRDTVQKALLTEVLHHLDPCAPAPMFGDAPIENASADAVSEAGHAVATTWNCTNLSFWAGVDYAHESLHIGRAANNMTLDPSKFYVAYMANASEMQQLANLGNLQTRQSWRDERRGSVKVGWGITPIAAELWPALVEYLHDTATPNDSFFCGISGYAAAYTALMTDAQLQVFAERTEDLLQLTGLGLVENWGGILHWTNTLEVAEKYKGWAPSVTCFAGWRPLGEGPIMDWLPDGQTAWAGITNEGAAAFNSADPELVTAYLNKLTTEHDPPLLIGLNGNNVIGYAEHGRDNLDPNVFEIVGVEDFVDLLTQAKP